MKASSKNISRNLTSLTSSQRPSRSYLSWFRIFTTKDGEWFSSLLVTYSEDCKYSLHARANPLEQPKRHSLSPSALAAAIEDFKEGYPKSEASEEI
jgi:hypothetical protein